ncbi:ABC transporter permease [Acinetobacter sp. ESL0695]|jgi:peptide/nickel transport system permease protein|uniref:ABC transporter permease n=1 Tax=Acinetobacter sp. ESL0695 TaxID=2983215 RepID=UPI0023F4D282|nr:ABC transporter permease [Acinetobacter sp. ESL0695]WEV49081.1 ABC transporter permease [Acinetobacter sp. ESL0695]
MLSYMVRRLWQIIPTLLGVILLIFVLFNWIGGDPAYILAGKMSNPQQIENIREQLGMNQPYYVQLWIFIKQVITFDYGSSWSTGETVSHIILSRVGPSLTIIIPLIILQTLISITLALVVALIRGTWIDRTLMAVCTIAMSISILVYIIIFQYFLAYKLNWFPVQGWGDSLQTNLFYYVPLPVIIMLAVSIAPTLRLYRSFVLDEIGQEYIRTARAKGVSESRILFVHVLRNAAIPIVTDVMSNLPALLIGAFLIERFFGIPGIGREVILAVERSDFPVIKAITVYIAALTMIFNLLADLTYKLIDPRLELK